MPAGRPSGYRPEFADLAEKFCQLGATDEQLAEFFEVDRATIKRWKQSKPDFCAALKRGKAIADAEIANSLYQRGRGYSHDAVKIFMPASAGEPVIVPYTEHYPPDTVACIFWLKNRRPDLWRDVRGHEHTGRGGGPIETSAEDRAERHQRIQRLLADAEFAVAEPPR